MISMDTPQPREARTDKITLLNPKSLNIAPENTVQAATALRDMENAYMEGKQRLDTPFEHLRKLVTPGESIDGHAVYQQARQVGELKEEISQIMGREWFSSIASKAQLELWIVKKAHAGWDRVDLNRFISDVRDIKKQNRVDSEGSVLPHQLESVSTEIYDLANSLPKQRHHSQPSGAFSSQQTDYVNKALGKLDEERRTWGFRSDPQEEIAVASRARRQATALGLSDTQGYRDSGHSTEADSRTAHDLYELSNNLLGLARGYATEVTLLDHGQYANHSKRESYGAYLGYTGIRNEGDSSPAGRSVKKVLDVLGVDDWNGNLLPSRDQVHADSNISLVPTKIEGLSLRIEFDDEENSPAKSLKIVRTSVSPSTRA